MKYKIDWMEKKETTTGKLKADATVVSETGESTDVTIWSDFPDFPTLAPGSVIEGEIKPALDPKYKPSLSAPRTSKTASSGGFKQKMIEDTMIRKEASITKFQATKEESIKLAGAQRDAVLLTQTLYGDTISKDPVLGEDEKVAIIKRRVIAFRDWLLSDEFQEVLPFSKDGTN